MRLACVASITLLCGCGQLAPDADSGLDASIDAPDASDASDASCAVTDAANCTIKLHYLTCGLPCDADVCSGFGSCVTDEDVCHGFPGADNCVSNCNADEYAAACGGGPKDNSPPSPTCREASWAPSGTTFYCCPCQ